MASLEYPVKIFELHKKYAENSGISFDHASLLEMGTGDSLASAILARKAGAKTFYTLDVGEFATKDVEFYQYFARRAGVDIGTPESFPDLLDTLNAKYLTNGLQSWDEVPDRSLDFIWSHSTLEHVRKHEFEPTIQRMYAALKPGGVASHNVHLPDHLDGRLNNLRFKSVLWEKEWWANSGFYTNRLRPSEIEQAFRDSGFEVVTCDVARWTKLPTPRSAMAPEFRDFSDEDLLATGMMIVARRPAKDEPTK